MALLTPKISDITEAGLSLEGDVTAQELCLDETDAVVSGPLAVGLELRRVEGTICVTGVVEGTAVRQCVRCLKTFHEPIGFAVRVAYEREPKGPAPAGRRETARRSPPVAVDVDPDDENGDIYHYAGDHVDLAPMLREQVILAAPMHPLCKPDCLGLCPQCGNDLNERPCGCAAEPTGGPFRILRALTQRQDESADPSRRR